MDDMFAKVKGTDDFYQQDQSDQDFVFDCFRKTARRFSFKAVEPPILESIKLLSAKSGEEIKEQIFTIEKKSKEELGLRFEFTAGLARMFAARQKEIAKPVKWFSIGRVWRYEQPQAGRMREFFQFNAEIYGSDNPLADAEIINLASQSLMSLGLSKEDFFVKVNNRKLLQGIILDMVKKDRLEETIRIIDKRAKIREKQFREELSFLDVDKLMSILDMDFDELGRQELNDLARSGYDELAKVMKNVDANFDLSTARGLAYYTGTVFEIFDKDMKFRALCGGGRYDDMIEVFGGQKTPATGFGMGYSTVLLLLKDKGILPKEVVGPDYFVASIGIDIMPIVSKLREKYTVDFDQNMRNLGNQMKFANTINAKNLIVIGENEISSGMVKVKDMKTGNETEKKLDDL